MDKTIRAYADLFRIRFFYIWPLLFCSGYLLATRQYGGLTWVGLGRAALIGFLGFTALLVLNDYIDRAYDVKDVDRTRLTKYWRMYGTRPIAEGLVSPRIAAGLAIAIVILMAGLILTIPPPQGVYVLLLMLYIFAIEIFYQEEKRIQKYPSAQIIGWTGFALFPVAGYLCAGVPDTTELLLFLFIYPFGLAWLGATDLADAANDAARGMKSISILYGTERTALWVAGFTIVHLLTACLFMTKTGWIARAGIIAGLLLLIYANALILRDKNPDTPLRVLPCFHRAMVLYALGISAGALI